MQLLRKPQSSVTLARATSFNKGGFPVAISKRYVMGYYSTS